MFLSDHDFGVVQRGGAASPAWSSLLVALAVGTAVVALVASRCARRPGRSATSGSYVARARAVPAELQALSRRARRARSERLAESREREARLEESRRELVSWVSHDLRTPLAGMRAMTEALEDGMADDPARYHRQIRAEVDRMVRMVDDLFELSRIHAGVLRDHARAGGARRPGQRGDRRRRPGRPGARGAARRHASTTGVEVTPTRPGSRGWSPTWS